MFELCCQSAVSRSANIMTCKIEQLDISIELKTGIQLFLLAGYNICRSANSAMVIFLKGCQQLLTTAERISQQSAAMSHLCLDNLRCMPMLVAVQNFAVICWYMHACSTASPLSEHKHHCLNKSTNNVLCKPSQADLKYHLWTRTDWL